MDILPSPRSDAKGKLPVNKKRDMSKKLVIQLIDDERYINEAYEYMESDKGYVFMARAVENAIRVLSKRSDAQGPEVSLAISHMRYILATNYRQVTRQRNNVKHAAKYTPDENRISIKRFEYILSLTLFILALSTPPGRKFNRIEHLLCYLPAAAHDNADLKTMEESIVVR